MPVFRLGRLSVDEDHAGRHGVGSLSIGVVKALDASRLTGKPQILLHLTHNAVAVPFGVNQLHVFKALHAVGTGVALRQLHGCALVAPLRHQHLNVGRNHLGFMRHQDQLGLAREAFAQLRHTHGHEFCIALLEALAKLEGKALNDRAVAYVQHVDVAVLCVAKQRKNIDRAQGGIQNGRLRLIEVEPVEALLDKLSSLKLLTRRMSHHLPIKAFSSRPKVSAQKKTRARHISQVACLVLKALAGRKATLNMKLQAGPILARFNGGSLHGQLAGAQRENLLDDVEHGVHHLDGRIGTKVF